VSGGSFAVRQLHTDDAEVLFKAARPILLNGIEDVIARPDLADRAILLTLGPIGEEKRRSEAGLWRTGAARDPGRPAGCGGTRLRADSAHIEA
jgi:hypothetical protein